jgi:hypothetical protein
MPVVSYYLGRPAHVWIAAMSRPGSAQKADNGSGVVSAEALCARFHKPLPRKRASARRQRGALSLPAGLAQR